MWPLAILAFSSHTKNSCSPTSFKWWRHERTTLETFYEQNDYKSYKTIRLESLSFFAHFWGRKQRLVRKLKKEDVNRSTQMSISVNFAAKVVGAALGCGSVKSRQDHVQALLVCLVGGDAARISKSLLVVDFVRDSVSCLVAWWLVRLQRPQLWFGFRSDLSLESLYDRDFATRSTSDFVRLSLSKRRDRVRNQTRPGHEGNLLPRHFSFLKIVGMDVVVIGFVLSLIVSVSCVFARFQKFPLKLKFSLEVKAKLILERSFRVQRNVVYL